MSFLLSFSIILVFLSSRYDAAYLVPEIILTQIGASYVLILKDDKISPVKCYIDDGKTKYSLDLFQQGISPIPSSKKSLINQFQPEYDHNVITSLGNGICGFKMDAINKNTTQNWNVSFIDQTEKTYFAIARVIIRPTFPRHEVEYVSVGTPFSIKCADRNGIDNIGDLNYCKLYNPENQLVKSEYNVFYGRTCEYISQSTIMTDFGIWKCLLSYKSHLFETQIDYEFVPIKVNVVEMWTNQTDTHIHIGCTLINVTSSTDYCILIRPDKTQITLRPGLATRRYTTLGMNIEKSACAMEIVKPLEETEMGLWRCEHHNKIYKPIGGFINVSSDTSKYKAEPIIPNKLVVQINETLTVTCKVPFSSPYCYMRGPDGLIYPIDDDRKTTLGECEFVKEKVQLTDNGTWFCGFGRDTGVPDELFQFQVYILESIPVQPETPEIKTRSAGTARLVCSTKGLGDYPLQYCRFLSPDGKMYHIQNHQTSDRISYEGRGLEYGDCGIIIQDVRESDLGIWSCITRVLNNNILGSNSNTDEVYTNIYLAIDDSLSLASTLGIYFGVILLIVPTIVYAMHRYCKLRNYSTRFNRDADTSQVLDDNNVGNRNYNATTISETQNPFSRDVISNTSDNNSIVFLSSS